MSELSAPDKATSPARTAPAPAAQGSAFPRSGIVFPAIGVLFYAVTMLVHLDEASPLTASGVLFLAVLIVVMLGTVFATVHHAEEIAHRAGEPWGTLVLTLAVTVIEVTLIVSLMLAEHGQSPLARDTVFAVIMIVCNGLVGLCLLVGGLRHHEQDFIVNGANAYLSVIVTLGTLTLVLPNFTTTMPGPLFSATQLTFVAVVTAILYGVFLYIQTVRHAEYFAVANEEGDVVTAADGGTNEKALSGAGHGLATRASDGQVSPAVSMPWTGGLLVVSLVIVILLAEKFGAGMEQVLQRVGAPAAVSGLIVALLVLLPEGMAAVRAAYRDELQRSLNLALGSSLATIGLTIPAVAVLSLLIGKELVLGLDTKAMLLFGLTVTVSVFTFGSGRTNVLPGFIHMVIFAAFVFLTFVP